MSISNSVKLILEALLQHPNGITRDEINDTLSGAGEQPVDRRRLHKIFERFHKSFGVKVDNERVKGFVFRYRFADAGNMRAFSDQLASNYLENNFLKTFRNLGARVQPTYIPIGGAFLRTIGDAMSKNHLLHVTYQKFSDVEPYDCILAPYVLKAFEGRWYLLAVKWMDVKDMAAQPLGYKGYGLQTFALDRMLEARELQRHFKMLEDFDAKEFFKPYFGVCCERGAKPVRIRVRASEQDAHYIRTLPIHHSQREKKGNIFELKLVPAKDFDIYMRRYPDTTWEVAEEKRGRKRQDEAQK